jgi:glycerol-3-phosphate acyltransferase PlsY
VRLDYAALIACYLLGAVPYGVIVGKIARGIDIRDYGSGNIGASNVLRTLGRGPAFVVFFLDTIKGTAAVVLCSALGMKPWLVVTGGVLSIIGHSFSVFLRFRGGKGVATSLGMIIGLNPIIAAVAFGFWLVIVGVTRFISVGSILAAASVPAMMFVWDEPREYQAVALVAALLIVIKHAPNIKRLIAGTETRIGQRVDLVDKGGEQGER